MGPRHTHTPSQLSPRWPVGNLLVKAATRDVTIIGGHETIGWMMIMMAYMAFLNNVSKDFGIDWMA